MTTATTRTTHGLKLVARPRRENAGFLPEVQALRAVAVGAVVVYHLWPAHLPGGFVGVDVFFAISGFLITAHLIRPLYEGRRIRVLRFWAARVWRLLPASLSVLVVCFFFTLWFTPVTVASNALSQIGASAAYVVNWVLASDAVDYLNRTNDPTIVQHYWTLSVEEQFYLLWPLMLAGFVAAAALVARRTSRRPSVTLALAVLTGLVIVTSCTYSVLLTLHLPARAYFDTFARVWEFAVGAALALAFQRFPLAVAALRRHMVVRRLALPLWLGLAMIAGSAVFMSNATPFPSGWAAVPVVGATLVILGGAPQTPRTRAMVGWRPVQWIGDVSYSIYLWHWPLIVGFAILVGRPQSSVESVLILAGTCFLAALTNALIENPFRRIGRGLRSTWPAFVLAVGGAATMIAATQGVIAARDSAAAAVIEQQEPTLADPAACLGANATLGAADCTDPFEISDGVDPVLPTRDLDDAGWCLTWFDQDWLSCELGDEAAPNGSIAIVGDSHAAALTNPLGEQLEREGMRLVTFTRYGCPGLSPTPIGLRGQTAQIEQACADWSARVVKELVARDDIDTVVFTAWESAYSRPEGDGTARLTPKSIAATLRSVADSGKRVVLLRDLPTMFGTDVPTCVAEAETVAEECSVDLADAFPSGPFEPALRELGARVHSIDMQEAVCDSTRCYSVVGDVVVYADDNHIGRTFARTLAPYITAELRGLPGTPAATPDFTPEVD